MHQQTLGERTAPVAPAHRSAGARARRAAGRYRASAPRSRQAPGRYRSAPDPAPSDVRPGTTGIVAAATLSVAALAVFDVALTERLSMFFDLCFILVGFGAALVVSSRGFFAVGVLPPLLLGAVVAVLAVLDPTTVTATHLAFVSTWLTGLAHHAAALVTTHTLVLATLALRSSPRTRATPARPDLARPESPHLIPEQARR